MAPLTGGCACGAVRWRAEGPILWATLRRCDDCRRAARADYASRFGVRRDGVVWTGTRTFQASSPPIQRSFCGTCGAPMSFETEVFPDETHLYAVTLDDPALYRPSAHVFWSERLPWVDPADDLPRHAKGLQAAAAEGRRLLD